MAERERVRTEQSFVVPKAAIAAEGYNLSMDRYSASSVGTIEHRAPIEIVEEIKKEQRSTADSLTSLRSIFSGAGAKVLDRRRVVLGDIISGIDTGRSPVCEARAAEENEWGVLKLGSVTYGAFRPDENKAYLGDVEKMQSNEVRAGDVLMTRKNTRELVGAVALVGEVRPRLLLPDLIFRLHLDLDRIDSRFFQALMMHPVKRLEVRRLAGGSAGSMPNISMARLLKLSIEIPSIEAQRKIADHLAATESYRARLQQVLQATDELYESQRDMAFRGEL